MNTEKKIIFLSEFLNNIRGGIMYYVRRLLELLMT